MGGVVMRLALRSPALGLHSYRNWRWDLMGGVVMICK